jgi:hypothetical protein
VLQPAWAPAIACGITLPLLLLPDGRLRSRRWRPMAAAAVAGAGLALVAGSLAPEPGGGAVPQPASAWRCGRQVAAVVAWVGVALFLAGLVAAVACRVLRFRAAHGSSVSSCARSPPPLPPRSPPSA